MPSAIADASVVIHLSRVEKLHLLHEFFDGVVVPEAVWTEVVEEGRGRPGVEELRQARGKWIDVQAPDNEEVFRLLREGLGPGESEAIALAVSHPDHILLVDEKDARRKARIYDLRKTGTVGLLVRAYAGDEIDRLRAMLTGLKEDAGFWISEEIIERAVDEAREQASADRKER